MVNNFPEYEDENLLVKKLKEGCEFAWRQVHRQYKKDLLYYAYDLLDNTEEAKDVVQELFVSIYEKRKKLGIKTSLQAYLFTAIRNRCLDRLEMVKTYKKHTLNYALTKELVNPPGEEDAKELLLRRLKPAIHQLTGDTSFHAFRLMHLEGKSHWQAAEELGISPITVRVQVSRIFKKIRKIINSPKLI